MARARGEADRKAFAAGLPRKPRRHVALAGCHGPPTHVLPVSAPPSATIVACAEGVTIVTMLVRGRNAERFNEGLVRLNREFDEGLVRLSREFENLARRNLTDSRGGT